MTVTPFTIDVPESALDDLRDRLRRTRWPNEIDGIGWEQGIALVDLQDLVAYWADVYDWRAHEAHINQFPQGTVVVDGQRVHFLHVRSRYEGALPLVLSHGWPSSFVEFLDVIPLLVDPPDPADAFHVVVPSHPGYGFSGPTTERGWTPRRIAEAFSTMMDELGYERYGLQGGDWGSVVSSNLADLHPDRVVGLHLNYLAVPPPRSERGSAAGGPFTTSPSVHMVVQGTTPQSIGYLLDDSPTGLAGWIVERFRAWSDCGGEVEQVFTKDQLLTNVMVYWLNRTTTSAARLYWEMRQAGASAVPHAPITVPTGFADFAGESWRPRREDADRRYNIVHWSEQPRGGHFPAFEVPDLFVDDVRTFFRTVRS